jgi:hypothetical protein
MLVEVLKTIPDHRDKEARQYPLWEVLILYVCAILSNSKTYEEIGRFGNEHYLTLKILFGMTCKKFPHYTHIRRILIGISNEDLEKAFREHSEKLIPRPGVKQICFDGKAMRGSGGKPGKSATSLFSAFDAINEIALAHMPLEDKESEIPALQELLTQLKLKGVVVTADALHCQKKHLI